ncbi:MAG: twin-arginine translocation signal domain-containing protein [Chloroflexota bacterium]
MAVSRRNFLKGLGAGISVLVVGGGVYRAADQGVFSAGNGPAYEPWENWRTDEAEGALRLVQSGILAANPHNSQPWRFDVMADRIDVYAETTRNIGVVDPFLREMYMGVGCALENMMLTAAATGYDAAITLMPDESDTTLAATITLTTAESVSSDLYDAIPNRHTNRGAYDQSREVPQSANEAMEALNTDADVSILWLTDEEMKTYFSEQTLAATEAFIADTQQQEDSDHWLRHDWQELQEEASGITYDAQLMGAVQTTLAKVNPRLTAEQSGPFFVAATERHLDGAREFGMLIVRDARDNVQRLNGGRLWQRIHLWATNNDIAMQPLNQLAERADREQQLGIEPTFSRVLAELVNDDEWVALMPFRFGYATQEATPSPRRDIESVLV